MDKQAVYASIKVGAPELSNQTAYALAGQLWYEVLRWHKREVAEIKKQLKGEASKAQKAVEMADERIRHFIDNPMPPEDEAKYLRAYFQSELAHGQVNPQLLDKYNKILGVNTGEDSEIATVDFSEAFPDLAAAVAVCTKPQPTIP